MQIFASKKSNLAPIETPVTGIQKSFFFLFKQVVYTIV